MPRVWEISFVLGFSWKSLSKAELGCSSGGPQRQESLLSNQGQRTPQRFEAQTQWGESPKLESGVQGAEIPWNVGYPPRDGFGGRSYGCGVIQAAGNSLSQPHPASFRKNYNWRQNKLVFREQAQGEWNHSMFSVRKKHKGICLQSESFFCLSTFSISPL